MNTYEYVYIHIVLMQTIHSVSEFLYVVQFNRRDGDRCKI